MITSDSLDVSGLPRTQATHAGILLEPTAEGIRLYERSMHDQGRFEQRLADSLPAAEA